MYRTSYSTSSLRRAVWLSLAAVLAACGPPQPTEPTPPSGGGLITGADASADDAGNPGRVVAIGDLHGDLAAAEQALALAGVVDDSGNWIGGTTTVVQLGDVLDRGDEERAIIDWLLALETQAQAAGGKLTVLNGNHEIITVGGYYEYATLGACEAFADLSTLNTEQPQLAELSPECRKRGAALLPGGPYAKVLASWPVSVIIDDSVFVHAGLFPTHVDYGLDRINDEVRDWMNGTREQPPGPVNNTTNSMVWTRTFGESEVPATACELLSQVLDSLGLNRMVVAHTVQSGVNQACDGAVWRVDTGMADFYGGNIEVLEITAEQVRVLRQYQ